ncbi:MAG: tRNA (uridine(34)/cytosine(34)/5-carboxymethylaminomethyluridine(34)-2'-O)-methyltransferase TrmL [Desulfovibrionales bacterium GWA2_65_9]|nr:MAG: tRNA (uridine(34)/cytosine(34)/5-carboxymethylaminomethyluridine(34)-2'-O)-methyltransferase TrmL [Desulfovibrionales bacterium GWA2_65_9]
MRLVLYQPEIPPNTGNVARLCAALRTPLSLIEPLGFKIDDKHLKRAGLDYWPLVDLSVHAHWAAFEAAVSTVVLPTRIVLTSARVGTPVHRFAFRPGDAIVLGQETKGLPEFLLERYPDHVRIPIACAGVRSLNMSTAAGILLFEALRQTGGLAGDLDD